MNQSSTEIPAIELRGLTKRFNGVAANDGVHVKVRRGSIHAIIGENGAGKSTAMKLLYGMIRPDGGEILVNGKAHHWKSPSQAIAAGIGMVHQHFMLADPYSAFENIVLGGEADSPAFRAFRWLPRWLAPVDRAKVRLRLDQLSERYGLAKIDWSQPIEELPVGIQQRIEILKLLYRDAEILILDEPTAVLTPQETAELFTNLRKLAGQGKTILIITHKLKEVMALSDDVTVFRAGKVVGARKTSETNVEELADLMVGRKVVLRVEVPPQPALGKSALEFRGVSLKAATGSGRHRLSDLSFSIRRGEVVGIAGVEGNGQSELLRLILHPDEFREHASGEIFCLEQKILGGTRPATTDEIKALGVGIVPEDRHRQGLLLERPAAENFLLGLHRREPFGQRGLINSRYLRVAATRAIETYDVRPRNLEINAGALSGGNQQKLIIAREFERAPRLLIAAQPTRGVDVGAIEFIHKRILEARTEGAGVLLVSSELDEITALSDRILVMYAGKIVAEFRRGEASEQQLGLHMGGANHA